MQCPKCKAEMYRYTFKHYVMFVCSDQQCKEIRKIGKSKALATN